MPAEIVESRAIRDGLAPFFLAPVVEWEISSSAQYLHLVFSFWTSILWCKIKNA